MDKIGRVDGFLERNKRIQKRIEEKKEWNMMVEESEKNMGGVTGEQLILERNERIQKRIEEEEEWNMMVEESEKNVVPCMIEGCNRPSLFKWPPVPDGEWINDPNVCTRCYLQLERIQGIIRYDDGQELLDSLPIRSNEVEGLDLTAVGLPIVQDLEPLDDLR